ncbi:hypothetical protein M959_06093, partial [Chaetura pelagica]
ELKAVLWALVEWKSRPLNIVSDSLYVVGVVQRIEDAVMKPSKRQLLGQLFLQVQQALHQRISPCCILHIRSHQLPIGLGEGNDRADKLVANAFNQQIDSFQAARISHSMFHQGAKMLKRQFQLPWSDAQGIVKSCDQCSRQSGLLGLGVNPRGLISCEIWQMDVTHYSPFGRLKYLHVTVDTFSHMIWATAQTGEKASHVIRHLCACFAVLGVPQQVKTDNGPAYCSTKVNQFLSRWGVNHITGVPHNPTGQAIVERANQTLKSMLEKQ